ncbi:bifunctional diaminohydroxyphosphoribosylaminopyrimidine deaminase/5-amino-6-(5-phosphoribosylamino)uracil reductase RibD [Arthrobacter sp. zg-ZUI100]|uniref:bifunctional diaminohydroxyphosphoribosylaminopyrimidine deaminase/5-amino-6-(5-phosphoribosylamino)uracil reductase RibD n=1 Tax=Arthrobacter jiangjiafuii TaxID=2817475 RepID=UPI001AEDE214|nr:bifunctional diaminohydroxyphosphoribosylaminopyrimidine deaminase/5-amino-6-(5-phosphoribosylamino)uracil reductase RibD [Arthrobacter jiangjiafuii]MBP3036713.1 bifunctional diaminohydroxyphosphoribosylaminopyrimidine deaminase/5-amino-6-(5-phosphoribosylamino)uracil reductase RibD [Arthrobacter jiangjiafuii]
MGGATSDSGPLAGPGPVSEADAMAMALELARRGVRGANPLVGAVILDPAGQVLAHGYHRGAGTPHAEADALAAAAAAGTDVSGATMVVTLEPCNHTGRTGPCSQAILAAGISRVVYAAADSNAEAAGGAAALAAAGTDVEGGLLAAESAELNHRWALAMAGRRPFVTVKTAQTLDGRTAAEDGTSQWITGSAARTDGHGIRSRADAVVVGTGTVLADDPQLTARDELGGAARRQPLRVAVGHRPVPDNAAIRGTDGRFLQLDSHDPEVICRDLYGRGMRHLMVEGGAQVASAFLRAGLADELVAYVAPVLLGAGTSAVGDLGVQTLADASRWRWDVTDGGPARLVGQDLRLRLEPVPETGATPAEHHLGHRAHHE